MAGLAPRFVVCPRCGRDVPNGSIYCPYCCGESGRQAALLRAALKGALLGLLAGCLLAGVWTAVIGLDRATWGRALAVVLAGLTTGLILAMARHRRL